MKFLQNQDGSLIKRFQSFVREEELFTVDSKILAAVSGGRDSVLMALLLQVAEVEFGIAHCNFQLRGKESEADAEFCREFARSLGVPFYQADFDTLAYAEQHKISTQMAARKLRYSWFEEVRKKYGYHYIALAHHQNDSVETVLLNLTRGTGISGLHGILPKRAAFIRPLLFLTREEIDEITDENQIAYREDSSNSSSKYARNKIRLEVIPQLKALNPSLEETFIQNSARFAGLEELLQEKVQQVRPGLFLPLSQGGYEIRLEKLKVLKPLKLLLYELFRSFGFSESVLQDLVHSWDGQPGKVFASASHYLLLDRNKLLLYPAKADDRTETGIEPGSTEAIWGNVKIGIEEIPVAELQLQKNPKKAYFDAGLIQFPLKIRSWETGDWFFPFGMQGKKKLSDFFTGMKIPLAQKNGIPVLVNGNGDILWVGGFRSDERYKITSRTRKVIIFEIQN